MKVDVDKNQGVVVKYQLQEVPTFMVFKNGKIVWRQRGVVPAQKLVEVIEESA